MNPKQKLLLDLIKENPYLSQKELATKIDLSRSATANLISDLVAKGYLLGRAYILSDHDKPRIVCIGAMNLDVRMELQKDPVVYTSNPVSVHKSLGGVVSNVASNLVKLDQSVSLISRIGDDDRGQEILDGLDPTLDTSRIDRVAGMASGQYNAVVLPDGNLYLGLAEMDICEQMDKDWISNYHAFLKQAPLIVVDSNVTQSALEWLLDFSIKFEKDLILVGVSAIKMARLPQNLKGLGLLVVNVDESQAYLKTREEDPKKLVEAWLKRGVLSVVVTKGSKGAAYGSEEGIFDCPAINCDHLVDVTGAGDSFAAGLAFGKLNQMTFEDSMTISRIMSYLTITSHHSVRPDLSLDLIDQVRKEKNL